MACTPDLGMLTGALVAGIGVDGLIVGAHQVGCLVQVMDVGRGRGDRVGIPGAGIDSEVGLHAEVPLVALLGLMQLRVTGTGGVLGRGRCRDDGGVDDRPAPHDPPLALEDLVLSREQPLPELAGFEEVPEVEQRGRVRDHRAARRPELPQRPAHP